MNYLITSLLDTDLYKFTMMQCVFHYFPNALATYRFICRKPVDLRALYPLLKQQIEEYCKLTLSLDELEYLKTLPYFKADFIEFLSTFTLNPHHINLTTQDNLEITLQGPWLHTILFEVPLLAMVSEAYHILHIPHPDLSVGYQRLEDNITLLKKPNYENFRFSDFGTRRRFSKSWQETLLTQLKENVPEQFVGTSNVYFAKKLNLKPIGTMAHEFLQACQVLAPSLIGSQKYALTLWEQEYQGQLGIALTDTLTTDVFLQEFDQHLVNQYTGMRQDSGDPFAWGKKIIQFYQNYGIDPRTKTLVFSDNLTIPLAQKIYDTFKGSCQLHFGIGTHLTNDLGYPRLDMVIKMTQMNHQPVVKISDSPGKIVADDANHLLLLKKTFHLI